MRKALCVNGGAAGTVTAVTGRVDTIELPEVNKQGVETGRYVEYELTEWPKLEAEKKHAPVGQIYLIAVSRKHSIPNATEIAQLIETSNIKPVRKEK